MTNRYSLADYQLVITIPEGVPGIGGQIITIGGPGDYNKGDENGNYRGFVGQFTISRSANAWDTEGDRTGSWVHNQNRDKTGTCEIQITQIAESVIKLAQICSVYENLQQNEKGVEGLTVQVQSTAQDTSMPVASAEDCLIQKIPDQVLGETAEKQSWVFTCGRIEFYS